MAIKRESINKENQESFESLLKRARLLDEDDDAYWDIVWLLGNRGDRETFEKGLALTRGDEFERNFGALILGRFGAPKHPFSAEIIDRLLEMISAEKNQDVIASLISSLGQQEKDPRTPIAICPFVHHPDDDVRWILAVALGGYETPEAIKTLIVLSRDSDIKVRDWATFGLGNQCDLNTPEIRAALFERLNDEDEETRAEAIWGLAKRKDRRVIPAIQREFDAGSSGTLLFQAIIETPAVSLLATLRKMAQDPDFLEDGDIEAAIAACEAHPED